MPSAQPTENTQPSAPEESGLPEGTGRGRGRTLRWIVFLLIAAAVGVMAWRIATARQAAESAAAAKRAAMSNQAIPVAVTPVHQGPVPIYLTGLGTVTPYYTVTVKAQVSGELVRVNFREGQEVGKGQELMTIDPRPYQAALDQAKGQLAKDQAQLRNSEAEYERYQALYKEGIVSREQLGTYEATLGQYQGTIQADKAAIDTAALNLAYCHIKSPIDGRVGLRLVDPGNIISANTTNLIVINQFKPIAVIFTLPESQLEQVVQKLRSARQMQVEAYDRSDTMHIASGRLLTADNQIDTTTGTGKLKAVFANEQDLLFPNQFVNVHLVLEERQNALTIPAAGLQHGTNGDFVWIVKPDNTAAMQPVKVAATEGSTTILESGVEAGAMVITDGADKLRTGTKVKPRPASAEPASEQGAQPGTAQALGF